MITGPSSTRNTVHARPHTAMGAAVASGVLLFASTGANHLWPLAWIAFVPLLAVVPDIGRGRAALAAFIASSIGALNLALAYWPFPPALVAGIILSISAPFTLIVVLWHALSRRLHPALSAVAYAALVVSVEYVVSLASPNGTFGSIAYSQTDVLPIVQIASLTGLWGISFLLSIVAAAGALAWRARHAPRHVLALILAAGVPLVAALTFGVMRLAAASPSDLIRVGLATNDPSVPAFNTDQAVVAERVVSAYADRAIRLAERGAQLVVLPEKFVGIAPAYKDQVEAVFSRTARARHVMIVAGLNLLPGSASGAHPRNTAFVFDAEGRVLLEYDKVHLVPGLESSYRPGHQVGVLNTSPVRAGVAICKDLDFVALGRAYGTAGVGLLLVPAWDFVNDGWLHSRMALMRSVENGYALVRTASEGRLIVADGRGRIVAEAISSDAPEVLVTASVPIAQGGTIYSRAGDWFAWLCVLTVIASGLMRRTPARPAGSASSPAEAPTPGQSPATRG